MEFEHRKRLSVIMISAPLLIAVRTSASLEFDGARQRKCPTPRLPRPTVSATSYRRTSSTICNCRREMEIDDLSLASHANFLTLALKIEQ
jgi:hypothetical protein